MGYQSRIVHEPIGKDHVPHFMNKRTKKHRRRRDNMLSPLADQSEQYKGPGLRRLRKPKE